MWGRMDSCGGLATRQKRRLPAGAQLAMLPHNRTLSRGHGAGGLFTAFHVKAHHAGIGLVRRDHLEYHPAVGRTLEEPVVSDRQRSRRREIEGDRKSTRLNSSH